MDDIFSKIKRKILPQASEVISPAEREHSIRKMLGYDPIEENIDPEFYLPKNPEIEENEIETLPGKRNEKPEIVALPGRQNEKIEIETLPDKRKIKKSKTQKALEILNKPKF